jgi:ferredoxin-NADP reductase
MTHTLGMGQTLILKNKLHEYGEVNTYVFEPLGPVTFRAGQFCHLYMPDMPIFSRWVRKISFASCPSDKYIVFSIKDSPNKLWHQKLKVLEPGDKIRILGSHAHGNLTFPSSLKQPVICIAGGMGATPFRSLFRNEINNKSGREITFIHVASNEYLYEEEFSEYPISRYLIRRKDVDKKLGEVVSKYPNSAYLIAGSKEFARAIAKKLVSFGVSVEGIQGHRLKKHRLK